MDGRNLSERVLWFLLARGFPIIDLRECGDNLEPFCAALSYAVDHNKFGPYVDKHTPEQLRAAGVRAFLSQNRMAGIAVWPDGNIRAIFNDKRSPYRKAIGELMLTALSAGGDRLDCFSGFLSELYPLFGFIPVARVKFNPQFAPDGWRDDFGTPDIIFFKHCGDSMEKVAQSIGRYPSYPKDVLLQLPCLNSYEEAYKFRDEKTAEAQ